MIERINHLNLELEINDEWREAYNSDKIKFKMSMIRSNLCRYSDAYIHVNATITVPNTTAAGAAVNNTNKN